MNQDKTAKKRTKIYLIGAVCLGIIVLLIPVYQTIRYMEQCPVITPKSPVMAEIGETIPIEKLADFESTIDCGISYHDFKTDAKVSANGQFFYAGTFNTSYDLTIYAVGPNYESTKATVTVMVMVD